MRERVVIAMSGGVDSSLAAALLVEEGHEVIGLLLRLWKDASRVGKTVGGSAGDDFADARRVADRLGIDLQIVDVAEAFRRLVVDDFVAEYRRGRTPNPCARCNRVVKFASLCERARDLGASRIATGHYARVGQGPGGPELLRGVDPQKDQSYYLFDLPHEMLVRSMFPVGGLTKTTVREQARRRGLPVAAKAESQEVCFVRPGEHAALVAGYDSPLPLRPGPIVDGRGEHLGRHDGVHRFTIGQRRGLGLGFGGPPLYVTEIDATAGVIRVGDVAGLLSEGVVANGANWLGPPPRVGDRLTLKIRSRFAAQPAVVSEASRDRFIVTAPHGLRAVTPGQAAVLYDGDRVVGGGWIERPIRGR